MRRFLWLLGALVAATGCVDTPAYENRLCDRGGMCPSGYACGTDFRCHHSCSTNADCQTKGQVCVSGMCEGSTSTSPASSCTSSSDCTTPGPCEMLDGSEHCDTAAGHCVYGPKLCNSPPAAQCLMNNTLFRTYASGGQCELSSGQCTYTMIDTMCTGCMANCLEPCQGVQCNDTTGGCQRDGHCVPGTAGGAMPHCEFTQAPDHASCVISSTGTTSVHLGMCASGVCFECMNDADCDDHNACTKDGCDRMNHVCIHVPQPGMCDDGNRCTQTDLCVDGRCVGMNPIVCMTTMPGICQSAAGSCDPASGTCSFPLAPAGTACPDDGNPCTDDFCSPTGQCTHPAKPTTATCNDGNACTSNDHCNGAGACGGTLYSCNDGNVCHANTCDGQGGCTHTLIPPPNVAPNGGTQSGTAVALSWDGCPAATSYEVEIQFYGNPAGWYPYFTYTGLTSPNQTFYPCSSTSPYPPCNSDFRHRARAIFGGTAGPWSNFVQWHWGNCRAC